MEGILSELRSHIKKVLAGGGEAALKRNISRNKLLPRERIDRLLDHGSSFLELSQDMNCTRSLCIGPIHELYEEPLPQTLKFIRKKMMQMDGGDRLRVTLLDCMETGRSSLPGLTLEAILMADRNGTSPPSRNQSNRTLLDVMQREHRHNYIHRDKTAWKSLREKLRLKRNSTVWISSNSNPIASLNTPILNRDTDTHQLGSLLSNSRNAGGQSQPESASSRGATAEGRLQLGAVLAAERALSAREEETLQVSTEVQPARMSLMELLDENEGQVSLVGAGNGEEEERGAVEETAAAEISCCVCMVRSKGAAFIPCGHTFCRLCSRELWVQRGNCPLCNTSISEILDLF